MNHQFGSGQVGLSVHTTGKWELLRHFPQRHNFLGLLVGFASIFRSALAPIRGSSSAKYTKENVLLLLLLLVSGIAFLVKWGVASCAAATPSKLATLLIPDCDPRDIPPLFRH